MTKPEGPVWFLASCIELYKSEKGLTGRECYNYLLNNGALSFIINCWEGLHMTGPLYIVDSIDEFIQNQHPSVL